MKIKQINLVQVLGDNFKAGMKMVPNNKKYFFADFGTPRWLKGAGISQNVAAPSKLGDQTFIFQIAPSKLGAQTFIFQIAPSKLGPPHPHIT